MGMCFTYLKTFFSKLYHENIITLQKNNQFFFNKFYFKKWKNNSWTKQKKTKKKEHFGHKNKHFQGKTHLMCWWYSIYTVAAGGFIGQAKYHDKKVVYPWGTRWAIGTSYRLATTKISGLIKLPVKLPPCLVPRPRPHTGFDAQFLGTEKLALRTIH